MTSMFDVTALLLTLSALFGWLNRRFVHLPNAIGLLLQGLLSSLLLILFETILPGRLGSEHVTTLLQNIDFTDVVMNGMLAFLLFAGSMNIDLGILRDRAWPVAILSIIGTVISTAIVGVAFWAVAGALGTPLSLAWALVFGALISPTDPVAVLATLKTVRIPEALRIEMEGEALFNDGVGVVLFTVLLGFAANTHGTTPGVSEVLRELVVEAGGGLLLGVVTGYIAYRALRAIDDFPVEVLITLSLVAATYVLAQKLGMSGPLSVVAAGLLIGEHAPRDAMSERTQRYVSALWTLVDEVLNAVLFLLIGLEVVVVRVQATAFILAAAAIPIVVGARFLSVSVPLLAFRWTRLLSARNVPFLTWAGIRGGISVALALSLPRGPEKPIILTATYALVLFSIVVQGMTLPAVARATLTRRGTTAAAAPDVRSSRPTA